MCFTITGKSTATRATEDIKCYKILKKGNYESPFNSFDWHKGEIKKSVLKKDPYNPWYINEGFHSFITKEDAIEFSERYIAAHLSKCNIYIMVIPKGAMYYKNRTQYVSNRMYLKTGRSLKIK